MTFTVNNSQGGGSIVQMRIPLTVVALFLAVEAFSQQSAKPRPAVLLHGKSAAEAREATGAIYGVVIAHGGRPAKGITVTALWLCPETCMTVMSSTLTNEAGEYRFEPVTFGKYSLSVPYPFDLPGSPPKFTACPLGDNTVELSPDHREAEVRFEVCERVPRSKGN